MIELKGPGTYSQPVVGESHYQAALEAICGKRTNEGENKIVQATLVLENNPHDPQAVRIDIQGKTVGYLSRDDARVYRKQIGKNATCQAVIRGGWDRGKRGRGSYGVSLDLPTGFQPAPVQAALAPPPPPPAQPSQASKSSLLGKKINIPLGGKNSVAVPLIVLVIAAVMLCCIVCLAWAMLDSSLRSVGILPTNTPRPPATAIPTRAPAGTPTPKPTSTRPPVATAIPPTDEPALPTQTSVPVRLLPTVPLDTPTQAPIVAGPLVRIASVNKSSEYVDIHNGGDQPQDLAGWKIVSVTGNQVCWLSGVIGPGQTIRFWTEAKDAGGGPNCGLDGPIWNNQESDPAELYDASGQLIDRN